MEEKNKFKGMNIIVLIIFLVALLVVGIVAFNIATKQKNIHNSSIQTEITENVGKIEQPTKTETTTIDSAKPTKYMAAFKYDLVNNQLSNFDIAFLKAENEKKNKIYSPLSIKYTLKMLEEGAKGTTKTQISNVLEDYKVTKYASNKNMSLANALFVRDTFKDSVKQTYITNLKNKYNAEVIFDSFSSAKNINDWVKNKTLNIIPELLDEIDADKDFILVNALGIDMEWKNRFFDRDNYNKGFVDNVNYSHEECSWYCDTDAVSSEKFGENQIEISGMQIAASFNNYDILTELGEDNIRKTVGEKYREWLKSGEDEWGRNYALNGDGEDSSNITDERIEKEVTRYLNEYIKEINSNYKREDSSIDFSLYVDDAVKVVAKDLKEYNGTTLQYIGIMPINQDLDQYVKSVDSAKLNNIISSLKELKGKNFKEGVITRIKGFIPKFNFEYTLKLKNDLAKIGIKDIFDDGKADISELTSAKGEYISDAIHKANIEFTQDGIKAAAATMAGGAGDGSDFDYFYKVPIEDIDLTFDKPYMFIIRDKGTGDVWFTGTVYEPLKWEDDTTIE